ncbi:MAG: thiamine phosphate synthase [Lachnospiraceae bacterium]|nr:thiamine phosphate synthase [Lachnospiraceae bacterium]
MKCDKKQMLLYAVTDRSFCKKESLYEQVEKAIRGGVTCVQLREKNLPQEDFLEEAKRIGALCRRFGVPLIINDNVEVAIRAGADGVHVGQDDMSAEEVRARVGEDMIIGVSAHSVEEAKKAHRNGADYLGVGAMFATSTKSDTHVLPKETLREICRAVPIPVVAIGGIGASNLMELTGCGADGVALVSAIFGAEDIERECQKLRKLSEEMVRG